MLVTDKKKRAKDKAEARARMLIFQAIFHGRATATLNIKGAICFNLIHASLAGRDLLGDETHLLIGVLISGHVNKVGAKRRRGVQIQQSPFGPHAHGGVSPAMKGGGAWRFAIY